MIKDWLPCAQLCVYSTAQELEKHVSRTTIFTLTV